MLLPFLLAHPCPQWHYPSSSDVLSRTDNRIVTIATPFLLPTHALCLPPPFAYTLCSHPPTRLDDVLSWPDNHVAVALCYVHIVVGPIASIIDLGCLI